jgi:uncharacterized protein
VGGEEPIVEWAVHMVRVPDHDRADIRLHDQRLGPEDVRVVATTLADFHRNARCDAATARYGTPEVILRNVDENFEQTREHALDYISPAERDEIETWQRGFLDANRAAFADRIDHERIRDGHGDLRLEHIYLDDDRRVTILDCIEFNDRFRYGDVCSDLAFLSMDMTWHGRQDLAERLLFEYARAANDFDLYPLVDFYESYRAFVRAKIATIVAHDTTIDMRRRTEAAHDARRFYRLALASERRPLLPPTVVMVGGLIGAGKSTLADRIADALGAPVVDSDRTRKYLLGVPPTHGVVDPPWHGGYAPDVTDRVYREVIRRADAVLRSGRSVIMDASFRTKDQRAAGTDLARRHGMPWLFIECQLDRHTIERRLRDRASRTGVSDGRLDILDAFVQSWEPVDELPERTLLSLDTSGSIEECVNKISQRIPTWPSGLTG